MLFSTGGYHVFNKATGGYLFNKASGFDFSTDGSSHGYNRLPQGHKAHFKTSDGYNDGLIASDGCSDGCSDGSRSSPDPWFSPSIEVKAASAKG